MKEFRLVLNVLFNEVVDEEGNRYIIEKSICEDEKLTNDYMVLDFISEILDSYDYILSEGENVVIYKDKKGYIRIGLAKSLN